MPSLAADQIEDPLAWDKFCEFLEKGGGVSDYPDKSQENIHKPTKRFFTLEMNRVEHHRSNLIPFLTDHCKLTGKRVLEFGAGTGGLSVAMAQAGIKSIEAVEPVKLNFETGYWRTKAYGLDKVIHFHHVPDTRHLPFEPASFDAVVCSSVLQYVPDIEARTALIKEMARMTSPGGMIIISSTGNGIYPAGPHSATWWSNLMPAKASELGHTRGISYWEVKKILEPLGFTIAPQGKVAIERFTQRLLGRCKTRPTRLVFDAAFKVTGLDLIVLAEIIQAPAEAFLPYPDLAFQKVTRH